MNFSGKSLHIDSKAVFSSAMLVGFGVSQYRTPRDIQWIEIWRLKYQRGNFKVRIAV